MDRKGFRDQARRFLQKYRGACAERLSPEARVALANDEALLHFHDDDDVACLHALAALPEPAAGATVWNRALCGGACTLPPARCEAAAKTRGKALAGRELRAKRRQVTQALCWDCKPGERRRTRARTELGGGAGCGRRFSSRPGPRGRGAGQGSWTPPSIAQGGPPRR